MTTVQTCLSDLDLFSQNKIYFMLPKATHEWKFIFPGRNSANVTQQFTILENSNCGSYRTLGNSHLKARILYRRTVDRHRLRCLNIKKCISYRKTHGHNILQKAISLANQKLVYYEERQITIFQIIVKPGPLKIYVKKGIRAFWTVMYKFCCHIL